MGNPNFGRDHTSCTSSPVTHDASVARVMMAVGEAADVGDPGDQRKRIPHGSMRAKLLNYIGQVFECKADSPHYSRRVLVTRLGGAPQARGPACVSCLFGLFGLFG